MGHIVSNKEFTLSSLPLIAQQLLLLNQKIMLFDAPMGAGKTTLIKEICAQLGSKSNFSSPTFQLVNEYTYPGGKIFHFDLYRIKSLNELLGIGFEDYVYRSSSYCFIEWPEFAQEFLQTGFIKLKIEMLQNTRYISVIEY